MGSDEVKLDVSRHSNFKNESHRAVSSFDRMGGWVLPPITPVSMVGPTASQQPIGIGAGLQGHTPLEAHPWSDPR